MRTYAHARARIIHTHAHDIKRERIHTQKAKEEDMEPLAKKAKRAAAIGAAAASDVHEMVDLTGGNELPYVGRRDETVQVDLTVRTTTINDGCMKQYYECCSSNTQAKSVLFVLCVIGVWCAPRIHDHFLPRRPGSLSGKSRKAKMGWCYW